MRIWKDVSKIAILLALATSVILMTAMAEDASSKKSSAASFHKTLKNIEKKYNVLIIADPELEGPRIRNIQGNTAEESLKRILEPLGYSYTKVDNYYLVSGPHSPLTVLAAADSTVIPVGFLDQKALSKLDDFKQYLNYNESLGVVYVKAPTSMLDKILSRLGELSVTVGQISIFYRLQIIDIGSSSGLDFLFSGSYDKSNANNKELIITPDQWTINSHTEWVINQKIETYSQSVTRQPWLITLPGKPVSLSSSTRSISSELDTNRYFTIQITPLKVNSESGEVTSDVHIERDMASEANFSQDGTVKKVSEPVEKVATIVRTNSGKSSILAVVRQAQASGRDIMDGVNQERSKNHRDFIVLISATPINIQSSLATKSGLLPVASLGGFERLMDEPDSEFPNKSSLELGISGTKDDGSLEGWLSFKSSFGLNNFTLDYRRNDLYSAGLSFGLDSETSFEFLAGRGIGPDDQDAFMFGLGDVTHPNQFLGLFAKYYPWSYLFDSEKVSKDGVWSAGARIGTENLGVVLSATGDPDYDGWLFRFDYSVKKSTWILEVDHTQDKPTYSLGVGIHF